MKRLSLLGLVAMLLAIGCKEKEPVTPERGRSYLHIVGAVPTDTFRVTFDYWNADDIVIDDFHYQRNFPITGYADLEAGGTPDEFGNGELFLTLSRQPFANIAPDTLMDPKAIVLTENEKATLCLVDSFGTYTIVKFKDEYTNPDANTVQIRFLNLSDQANASLTTTGGTLNISGIAPMSASNFTSIPAGTYDVEVQDTSGSPLQTISGMWLGGYNTITFYLSGGGSSPSSLAYYIH